jgi:beta-galactosidase
VYQPIQFVREGDYIRIVNRDFFTGIDEYDYYCDVYRNGEPVTCDFVKVKEGRFEIPYSDSPDDDQELILDVCAMLRQATPWADEGFIVAREQFILKPYNFRWPLSGEDAKPQKSEAGITIPIYDGSITIDSTGALTSWISHGKQKLKAPLEPYFWKPENDNQHAAQFAKRTAVWQDAGKNRTVKTIHVEGNQVKVEMSLPVGADLTLTYTAKADGRIKVDMDYQPKANDIPLMPKFGMRMRLPADYTHVEYYGRGPWENYPDRKRSAFIGYYQMPLSDFETDYVKPQDNGNRCDVRWLTLSSDKGNVKIEGLQPLCIHAWDYGEEDLETARHPHEINRGRFINLNIDGNIHGVGGVDTWGKRTLTPYTIDATQPHHLRFVLKFESK